MTSLLSRIALVLRGKRYAVIRAMSNPAILGGLGGYSGSFIGLSFLGMTGLNRKTLHHGGDKAEPFTASILRLMDFSLYKDVVTPRGLKYHYYYSPAPDSKPTLLFCHGFPSTSKDWRGIVLYLKEQGYGLIVPDMLGYGGTDKPTDPALYLQSAMSHDLMSILDAEKVAKVVAIGHDWGCATVSRLASWFPERVIAYAFFALPYTPPPPRDFNYDALVAHLKQKHGYELFGYWAFFDRDDADAVIQEHIETFVSLLWPQDPRCWIDRLARAGAIEETLRTDWTAPLAAYVSVADKEEFIATFRANGFVGPTCWYKTVVRGLASADDEKIPADRAYPPIGTPIFFGAAKHDYVCVPSDGYEAFENEHFAEGQVTTKQYDADHWLVLSKASDISRDLDAWIKGFAL